VVFDLTLLLKLSSDLSIARIFLLFSKWTIRQRTLSEQAFARFQVYRSAPSAFRERGRFCGRGGKSIHPH
jgi:hypothetical protein